LVVPMGILDLGLLLTSIVSLGVVFLPVELYILLQVRPIRRKLDGFLDSPEKRSEFFSEVAEQLWEPLKDPAQRQALIREVGTTLWEPLKTPEQRKLLLDELVNPELISKLGHGLIRAFTERAGSMKGASIRQEQSNLVAAARAAGDGVGLLKALPGKIELPIVGKVTPGEALELFSSLRGLLGGQGGQGIAALLGGGGSSSSSASGSSGASQLP